jgi:hypothetical protein
MVLVSQAVEKALSSSLSRRSGEAAAPQRKEEGSFEEDAGEVFEIGSSVVSQKFVQEIWLCHQAVFLAP